MSPIPDREAAPNFGQRRIYNKSYTSIHQGVDIAAPWGSPVRASNSGRVVLASSLYLSGKTVILDHGRGVFSLYGHFSQILIKRETWSKKGKSSPGSATPAGPRGLIFTGGSGSSTAASIRSLSSACLCGKPTSSSARRANPGRSSTTIRRFAAC